VEAAAIEHTAARMIFMGEAALTQGFLLIGFEVWPDPSSKQLQTVLEELESTQVRAFLVIDQRLEAASCPALDRVRLEGGHILVTSVPGLNEPHRFHSSIDAQIQSLLGNSIATREQS